MRCWAGCLLLLLLLLQTLWLCLCLWPLLLLLLLLAGGRCRLLRQLRPVSASCRNVVGAQGVSNQEHPRKHNRQKSLCQGIWGAGDETKESRQTIGQNQAMS